MLYILAFHERNLYTYAGGFGRAFCVKKRVAPARFGLPRIGREESGSENRLEHSQVSAISYIIPSNVTHLAQSPPLVPR